ncbi:MAG: hypothetical protein GY834_04080 [Bacteroidetes bacterium]|nr:hypothetical protein [Bacteroidota bacterium]
MIDNTNLPDQRNQTNLPSERLDDYKAFYHWLNAKPDSEVKIYSSDKRISLADIKELNHKLLEKLDMHEIVSNQTSVDLNLSNNRVLSFGSFEQFETSDFHFSAYTKSLNIIWDFYVQLPGYKLPQRHTLKLRFGSHVRPAELLQMVMAGDDDIELEQTMANAVCKIDFINPRLSSELFAIVTEWHEALAKNFYEKKNHRFIKRHQAKIEQLMVVLFLIAGVFLLSGLYHLLGETLSISKVSTLEFDNLFFMFFMSAVFMYVFYISGKFWSDRTDKIIRRIQAFNIFEITRGDSNSINETKEKNRKNNKRLGIEFFIALSVNLIAFFIWKGIEIFIN